MSATRNPSWTRDELILALDLYKRFGGNPAKDENEISELSAVLNKLGLELSDKNAVFRNANGVYMKVMNFRRFDTEYSGKGKKGLTRGNKLEEEIWNAFGADEAKLKATAMAIKASIESVDAIGEINQIDDDAVQSEAEEGRVLSRVHKVRERSRKLIMDKKSSVLRNGGRLACEACDFDFSDFYGERGSGFIEVHHTTPLHSLLPGMKTRLDDLALLCANCHRMIHAKSHWISIDELRSMIRLRRSVAA